MTSYRKKLIEVALPLDEINKAAAREKSIRHGHPSTLHPWWARRPLAAARAVLFSQIVDDPGEEGVHPRLLAAIDVLPLHPKYRHLKDEPILDDDGNPLPEEHSAPLMKARERRYRLFTFIETFVLWERTTDEEVMGTARELVRLACLPTGPDADPNAEPEVPPFHDPFAGGGAIPLEAQRLGMEAYASDLNPVAVLINKAMIEIPPKFAGNPPVNPEARSKKALLAREWKGAQGLADDVRYYGQWMRDEAEKRVGHLYPKVEVTAEMAKDRPDLKPNVGRQLTVIAWLWARTVKSPNPAFAQVDVPLASTFLLSTKAGKEAYVEPVIESAGYRFMVKVGKPKDVEGAKLGTTVGKRAAFRCLMSGVPVTYEHIRGEGQAGRMKARLMAIVAEGERGRVYLAPTQEHEAAALKAKPEWKPDVALPVNPRDFKTPNYGLVTFADLFTPRQLVALTTFSDLVQEAREWVHRDAVAAGLPGEPTPLRDGGTDATAYAEAVAVYLGMAVSKETVSLVSQARWRAGEGKSAPAFGRQALPMVWDFADLNPFAGAGGDFMGIVEAAEKVIQASPGPSLGHSLQEDASTQGTSLDKVVSTDPPYYDNIGYADLSDYFYVWLRQTLEPVFPDLFATLAVPKAEELVATPYRHGTKEEAETFFLNGMTQAMRRVAEQGNTAFPVTIYYAFKQSESETDLGTASTGWETFLEAVIRAGFAVSGTWPMRTENKTRLVGMTTNALASSIILVCRQRKLTAPIATRREFVAALQQELPNALRNLQAGNIAPVDLAQAAIGPGMAVYTAYESVLEADGSTLKVRAALQIINEVLAQTLEAQEGWYDPETRFAVVWYEQHGFIAGPYGDADRLSTAKGTATNALEEAGFLRSGQGKVKLYSREELPADFDPATDRRTTVWEVTQYLARALEKEGEDAAARLMRRFRDTKPDLDLDRGRELAYRLFSIADRKSQASEARVYDALVRSWSEIDAKSQREEMGIWKTRKDAEATLF